MSLSVARRGGGGCGGEGTVSEAVGKFGRQYVRDVGGVLDVVVEVPVYPENGDMADVAAWFDTAAVVLAAGAVPVHAAEAGSGGLDDAPMAEDFGEYCYLPAIKPERRERAALTFGKSVVTARLAAPAYADWLVSDAELHELRVTGVGSWCHLETKGGVDGTRLDSLISRVRAAAYEGRRDVAANILIGGPVGVVPVKASSASVGSLPSATQPSVFDDLLEKPDFTVCKCKVHRAPFSTLAGDVVGCCLKRVGAHPAVVAADAGKHRFCHASPATREADRALLELMARPPEVPSWKFDKPLAQVAVLQSDTAAEMRLFGRGYCYMDPIYARVRWRTARLFGCNSYGRDVLRAWDWVLRKAFKPMECVLVAPGFVHVRPVSGASGIDPKAGEKLRNQLAEMVKADPELRVGYTPLVDILRDALARCGAVVAKEAMLAEGFSLAVKKASDLDSEGQRRHRMLESVGDAYLSAALALAADNAGVTVHTYQRLRSAYTMNPRLMAVFEATELARALGWAESDYKSITGAKAYEAVAGVVARVAGIGGVAAYMLATGLLPQDSELAVPVVRALEKLVVG